MEEEKSYSSMKAEELISVIEEKDKIIEEKNTEIREKEKVIDGLLNKIKSMNLKMFGKEDIMQIYNCQSAKALNILKYMLMCKCAVKLGKEYYCTADNHTDFVNQMAGKEVFV